MLSWLQEQNLGVDQIFEYKKRYFDEVAKYYGIPEDEREKNRDRFLYGDENAGEDWELGKALGYGFVRGLGHVPQFGADILSVGKKIVPGDSETVTRARDWLEEKAERQRRHAEEYYADESGTPWRPSSMPERIAGFLGEAPGFIGAAGGATGTARAGVQGLARQLVRRPELVKALTGKVAGRMIPEALGLGAYEAISSQAGGPGAMAKGALHGAAMGGVLGASGAFAESVPRLSRLAHAGMAGAGVAALDVAAGAPIEQAIESGIGIGALAGATKGGMERHVDALGKLGIDAKQAIALKRTVDKIGESRKNYEISRAAIRQKAEDVRRGTDTEEAKEIKLTELARALDDLDTRATSMQHELTIAEVMNAGRTLDSEAARTMALAELPGFEMSLVRSRTEDSPSLYEIRFGDKGRIGEVQSPMRRGDPFILRMEDGTTTTHKTLMEAEAKAKMPYVEDLKVPVGQWYDASIKFLSDMDPVSNRTGAWMLNTVAKKLNIPEIIEKTTPIDPATATRLIADIMDTNLSEGYTRGGPEYYNAKYDDMRVQNINDVQSVIHGSGHAVFSKIFRRLFGEKRWEDRSMNMFDQAPMNTVEMLRHIDPNISREKLSETVSILDNLGRDSYVIKAGDGKIDTPNTSGTSYVAEGFSEYIRRRTASLDMPEYVKRSDSFVDIMETLFDRGGVREPLNKMSEVYLKLLIQEPMETVRASMADGRKRALANPVRYLGDRFYQLMFDKAAPILKYHKMIWPGRPDYFTGMKSKGEHVHPSKDPNLLLQMVSSSGKAQAARGVLQTGYYPDAEFGYIKMKNGSFIDALIRSGLVRGAKTVQEAKERATVYMNLVALRDIKGGLRKYKSDVDRLKRKEDLKYFTTPGELENYRAFFTQLANQLGEKIGPSTDIKIDGDTARLFDRIEANIREFEAKYKNPQALVDWFNEFGQIIDTVKTPKEAGGPGRRGIRKLYGAQSYQAKLRESTGVEEAAPDAIFENFYPMYEQPYDIITGREKIAWAMKNKSAPISDIITATTKLAEDTLGETYHNRLMNVVEDMIKNQKKAGLKLGRVLTESDVARMKESDWDPVRDRIISYRKEGRERYIQFAENQEGRMAYKSLSQGPTALGNWFLDKIVGGPKRMMVLGTTGANAGFLLVTNPIRDTLTASIQSVFPEGRGVQGMARTIKSLPVIFKSTALLWRTPETLFKNRPEYIDLFSKYMASPVKGSTILGADMKDARAWADEVIMRVQMADAESTGIFKKTGLQSFALRHPIEFVRRLFNVSEDLNRFPEFVESLKKYDVEAAEPMTVERMERFLGGDLTTPKEQMAWQSGKHMYAWKNAAEISIDFKRAGIAGRFLNEMIPFYNPSLQGLDKFSRVLFNGKEPSVKNINPRAMAAVAQGVTVPMIGMYLLNKDERWYKELPLWEKMIFTHLKLGDTVFRIPVPFEWGVIFGSLPIQVVDSLYNQAPEHIKEQMSIALNQLLPLPGPEMVPQVLKPAVEVMAGENFFTGLPIESQAMQRRLPTDRATPYTLETMKAASKIFDAIGMDASPLQLEHLFKGYTGTALADLIGTFEAVGSGKFSAKEDFQKTFLRRIVSNTGRPGQSVSDFYEVLRVADRAWNTAKRNIESGNTDVAKKVLLKYKKELGLDSREIERIVNRRKPQTPERLLEMHRASDQMASLRKKEENDEMTEIAEAMLGRDW